MKAYVHLWKCLAEVFLEWEMFQTKEKKEPTDDKYRCLFTIS